MERVLLFGSMYKSVVIYQLNKAVDLKTKQIVNYEYGELQLYCAKGPNDMNWIFKEKDKTRPIGHEWLAWEYNTATATTLLRLLSRRRPLIRGPVSIVVRDLVVVVSSGTRLHHHSSIESKSC